MRHLLEHHGIKTSPTSSNTTKSRKGGNGSPDKGKLEAALDRLYGRYGPMRFLAYWTELWGCYVAKVGVSHMGELAEEHYKAFTATAMAKMSGSSGANPSSANRQSLID